MTRRPGFTMPEVLVTMFVVAIGLTSVMATFPYGVKQMADANAIDRYTTHAYSMDALVRTEWKVNAVERSGNNEDYWNALDNPGSHPNATPANTPLPPVAATSTEPSYPVFLDSMGVVGRGTDSNAIWVGDKPSSANGNTPFTFIPRRNMSQVGSNITLAMWMWSQKDGFGFNEDGSPSTVKAEMREYRYNALAVLQRPVNRDRTSATLKVVVFSGRRPAPFPTGSEVVLTGVSFNVNSSQLSLPVSALTTELKKGSWIMDGTVQTGTAAGQIRHANFYRIVSVTENTAGTYDIELHTPIKRTDGQQGGTYTGTVVIPAGVATVFERPALTGSINP